MLRRRSSSVHLEETQWKYLDIDKVGASYITCDGTLARGYLMIIEMRTKP